MPAASRQTATVVRKSHATPAASMTSRHAISSVASTLSQHPESFPAGATREQPRRQAAGCRFYFSKPLRRGVHQMVDVCLRSNPLKSPTPPSSFAVCAYQRLQENPIEKHQIAKIAFRAIAAVSSHRYEDTHQNKTEPSLQLGRTTRRYCSHRGYRGDCDSEYHGRPRSGNSCTNDLRRELAVRHAKQGRGLDRHSARCCSLGNWG